MYVTMCEPPSQENSSACMSCKYNGMDLGANKRQARASSKMVMMKIR